MLQPLHIYLQSIFHRLDMKNLPLFPHHHAIFHPDLLNFCVRAKLIPLSHTIRKCRLRLVGHVIRMQSSCQTPLGTLLTTVPSNCHLRQGHGLTSTLQHNVADDLRSINCDVTSISGMTKSCFFNLVDTLD